jgi:tetratricopeptide (TPR) repeat protein
MDIKTKIKKNIQDKEYAKALKELSKLIDKDQDLLNCLILRGEVYYILEDHSKSLNDYNKAFKMNPKDKIIGSKIEMIKDILKFQSLNIYEATNLNLDPWLDD